MSNSTSLPQWDPAWVFPQQQILVDSTVTGLGYGCFLILAIVAMRVLIRRGLSSLGRRYLLAAVLAFLVSSTVFCVAQFAYDLANLALGPYNDNPGALKLAKQLWIATTVFSHLIYLLNDVLVVWRAWVVADRRILQGVLGFSMLIMIGCTIADGILIIQAGIFGPISVTRSLLLFIPLVFNNMLATSVVLYKTWIYRTQVKADLLQGLRKSQVERVLFLLIESGFIYCGWWVLFLTAQNIQSAPPMLLTVVEALSPFAAAIYPMLIILVVEHQKSQAEQTFAKSFSHSLQFNWPTVQSDGQNHSTRTQSVSIIQSIVDIQSAQKRSSHRAPQQSTSRVQSTGATSIIQSIVNIQSARNNKKEDLNAEKRTSRALHDHDLDMTV